MVTAALELESAEQSPLRIDTYIYIYIVLK